MDHPRYLRDLFAYNDWANRKVFECCRAVGEAALDRAAPGTFGTIAETLKHLIQVEDAYARMLGNDPLETLGPRDQYLQRPLSWFSERAEQLGADFQNLLTQGNGAILDEPLRVPWFDFPLTKADGFLQVLSHSAQHRTQVLSVLGERGVKVPNVDYIVFVVERAKDGKSG